MKRRQFTSALSSITLGSIGSIGSSLPVFAGLGLVSTRSAHAALGDIKVGLDDYTKRFMSFYEYATTAVAPPQLNASAPALPPALPTADERFETYKKVNADNPRGLDDAKLRAEFEAAWPRYEKSLDTIRAGFNGLKPSPADIIGGIGGALRMEQSLALTFICYVGTYSGQIISGIKPMKSTAADGSTQENSRPFVAFEIESYADGGDKKLALAMTDICMQSAGYARQQQGSVAESVIAHGVYMHAARAGLQLGSVEPLLQSAGISSNDRNLETVRAVRNKLQAPAANANANELLYAGALMVDKWLARGLSMKEIINTPKEQIQKVTATTLDQLMKK